MSGSVTAHTLLHAHVHVVLVFMRMRTNINMSLYMYPDTRVSQVSIRKLFPKYGHFNGRISAFDAVEDLFTVKNHRLVIVCANVKVCARDTQTHPQAYSPYTHILYMV